MDSPCFGEVLLAEHGWAEPVFGHSPKFRELEEAAHLDHLGPYYRIASYGVHPSSRAVVWNLQLLGDLDALIAGPSNAGLANPGHSLAISLSQLTVTLIIHDIRQSAPSEESLTDHVASIVSMLVALELSDRVGSPLGATHSTQEDEEQEKASPAERLLTGMRLAGLGDLKALADEWQVPVDLLAEAVNRLEAQGRVRRETRIVPTT